MKKLFIIVCILVLFIGGYFWYTRTSNISDAVIPPGKLKLADGSTYIAIPEFILKNEATTKLPSGVFRDIAGGDQSDYLVSYLPYNKENSQVEFNILLNTLPLSKARLEAEDILRTKLNVNNQELCKMDVSVYVFRWVDETYSGQNLGLSFCKNAIPLP